MAKSSVTKTSKAPQYKRITIEQFNLLMGYLKTIEREQQAIAEQDERTRKLDAALAERQNRPPADEKIQLVLSEIAIIMNTLRDFVVQHVDDEGAPIIQAMVEKTGWLADRGLAILSGRLDVIVGNDFAEWCHYGQAERLSLEDDQEEAQPA